MYKDARMHTLPNSSQPGSLQVPSAGILPKGRWLLPAIVALLALAAGSAPASIMVAEETWDDGSGGGWTESQSWVSLSSPLTGGVDASGYLRISFDPTDTLEGDSGSEWSALTRTPAATFFAGNWGGVWVEFDFYAEDVAPQYVQIRWQSTNNPAVWRATAYDSQTAGMSTGVWTHLVGPSFVSYLDWNYGGGSQEQFVNDLASIDWIGVYIRRNTDSAQDYGLDNFRLMVPEPGETMLLGAALVSAAFSLRRRLKKDPAEAPLQTS